MTAHRPGAFAAIAVAVVAVACGERDPSTPAEQKARGEAIVKQMSERLASARSVGVTATEQVTRIARDGTPRVEQLTRDVKLRRPNRLYMKVTGDRDLEAFYEGERLTLVSHQEKVYGEFKTPATIDDTIDVAEARYGISMPIGDLLTNNAYKALVSSQTTGGWNGRETIGGTACARLAWRHPNVDWTIWIPESGEPLPKRMHIVYKARRGKPESRIEFKAWNLEAPVDDTTFARRVPADYEGIAVIQRASAVGATPEAAPTSGRK